MAAHLGISPRTSPTICPRCGRGVEAYATGTLVPHNVRVGGRSCEGSGMPASLIPPWPGTIKLSNPGALRIRGRFGRMSRKPKDVRRTDLAAS